jgi:hypothetical protein
MLTAAIASCPDSQPADEARSREVMPAGELPQSDGGPDGLEAIAWIVTPAQVVASWAIPALAARQMLQQAGFRVGLEDSDETVRFKLLAATWVGESPGPAASTTLQTVCGASAAGYGGGTGVGRIRRLRHARWVHPPLFSLCRQSEWAQDPTLFI